MRLVFGAILIGLAGCDPCPQTRCASPPNVEIAVIDAETGAALETFALTGAVNGKAVAFSERCFSAETTNCRAAYATPPGNCDVSVTADGYEKASVSIPLAENACGQALATRRVVGLRKIGISEAALVTTEAGAKGCGE